MIFNQQYTIETTCYASFLGGMQGNLVIGFFGYIFPIQYNFL